LEGKIRSETDPYPKEMFSFPPVYPPNCLPVLKGTKRSGFALVDEKRCCGDKWVDDSKTFSGERIDECVRWFNRGLYDVEPLKFCGIDEYCCLLDFGVKYGLEEGCPSVE